MENSDLAIPPGLIGEWTEDRSGLILADALDPLTGSRTASVIFDFAHLRFLGEFSPALAAQVPYACETLRSPEAVYFVKGASPAESTFVYVSALLDGRFYRYPTEGRGDFRARKFDPGLVFWVCVPLPQEASGSNCGTGPPVTYGWGAAEAERETAAEHAEESGRLWLPKSSPACGDTLSRPIWRRQ